MVFVHLSKEGGVGEVAASVGSILYTSVHPSQNVVVGYVPVKFLVRDLQLE